MAMNIRKAKVVGMLCALALTAAPALFASSENVQLAPSFKVRNLVGSDSINLDELRGKVVYVDFWASWCGPCLKSFPFMESLHQQYKGEGLVIVAINMDQNPQDARKFLAEHPVSFLIGQDIKGTVAEQYGVMAMPSSFVIGRDGLINNAHYGFKSADKENITALISKLL
jgi:thiol-disulfide isomerase/thioredoxin